MTTEQEHTTLSPSTLKDPELVRALEMFERYPMHPSVLTEPGLVRRSLWSATISGVFWLCMTGFALIDASFVVQWASTFEYLIILPWLLQLVEWLGRRKMRHRLQLVWEVQPLYAMTRLKTFHLVHQADQPRLRRMHRKHAVIMYASGAGAIACLMALIAVYTPSLLVELMVQLSSTAHFMVMCSLWGALLTLSAVTSWSWLRYYIVHKRVLALEHTYEHLRSIAPELFTDEMLEGAISLPTDDTEFKGSLSQS